MTEFKFYRLKSDHSLYFMAAFPYDYLEEVSEAEFVANRQKHDEKLAADNSKDDPYLTFKSNQKSKK